MKKKTDYEKRFPSCTVRLGLNYHLYLGYTFPEDELTVHCMSAIQEFYCVYMYVKYKSFGQRCKSLNNTKLLTANRHLFDHFCSTKIIDAVRAMTSP